MRTALDVFDALFPPTSASMRQWRWFVLAFAVFLVFEGIAQLVRIVWRKLRR